MKSLKQFINETINKSLDEIIFEGFLDKLKNAISDVIDNPQKYIDNVKSQVDELKKTTYMRYKNKENIEAVAKELDKLNNDESLKNIYNYVKQIFNGKDKQLKFGLLGDSGYLENVFKDVEKTFNSDDNKTFAIVQIANAIAIATKDKFHVPSASDYYSNSHSHNSYHSSKSSRKAGMISAAVGAGMAMRR